MGEKENSVTNAFRLIASNMGIRLFRNQNGALRDNDGRWVRFGLGNESEKFNKICKSSDTIGWTSVTITSEMLGKKIAVFTAVEGKCTNWHETARDDAQRCWLDMIEREGGIAFFCNDADQFACQLKDKITNFYKLS